MLIFLRIGSISTGNLRYTVTIMLAAKDSDIRLKLPVFDKNHHYVTVAKAIGYLREHLCDQPSLATLARHVGMSSAHLLEVFREWAGITPKQFLKVLTLERAKQLLSDQASNLETSLECGLSGTGRLHDLFVTIEAVTPGEFKTAGRGLTMHWGLHDTPFGQCLLIATQRGLSHLYFPNEEPISHLICSLKKNWAGASWIEEPAVTQPYVEQIFFGACPDHPLPLLLRGTAFQVKVWRALLEIPHGDTTAYSRLAEKIGKPAAHRACATAVGDNPISYLIPCHRVLRKNLALGGYRWGLDRKTAILATELQD